MSCFFVYDFLPLHLNCTVTVAVIAFRKDITDQCNTGNTINDKRGVRKMQSLCEIVWVLSEWVDSAVAVDKHCPLLAKA